MRYKFFHNLIKIIIINICIFSALFILAEIGIRSIWSIKHFKNPHANYWGKTHYNIFSEHNSYVSLDLNLGFLPKKGFNNSKTDLPRWPKNTKVSINNDRFRENDNKNLIFLENERILVVGDSFAFGDQVSNNETWPSCIEKKLKIKTDNGGVSGYGAAQSVLRAKHEILKRNYSIVIWSIFFEDFSRDLKFEKAFPTVVKGDNKLYHKKIEVDYNKVIKKRNIIKDFFLKYSFILYKSNDIYVSKFKNKKDTKEKKESDKTKTSLKEVVSFAVNNFNKIDKKKIIVIQSPDQSKNSSENEKLSRNKTIKLLKDHLLFEISKYKISTIDMQNIFKKFSEDEKRMFWYDHYTLEGNNIVCEEIVNLINKY